MWPKVAPSGRAIFRGVCFLSACALSLFELSLSDCCTIKRTNYPKSKKDKKSRSHLKRAHYCYFETIYRYLDNSPEWSKTNSLGKQYFSVSNGVDQLCFVFWKVIRIVGNVKNNRNPRIMKGVRVNYTIEIYNREI